MIYHSESRSTILMHKTEENDSRSEKQKIKETHLRSFRINNHADGVCRLFIPTLALNGYELMPFFRSVPAGGEY